MNLSPWYCTKLHLAFWQLHFLCPHREETKKCEENQLGCRSLRGGTICIIRNFAFQYILKIVQWKKMNNSVLLQRTLFRFFRLLWDWQVYSPSLRWNRSQKSQPPRDLPARRFLKPPASRNTSNTVSFTYSTRYWILGAHVKWEQRR